jgi:5S rRNA maturation endonuclease (ribonuclease M5)
MYAAGFIPPGTYRIPNAQPLTVSQWLSPRYACDAVPTLLFVYRDVDGVTAGLRFRALMPHEYKSLSARRVNGLTEALAVPFGAELLSNCGGRVVHIAEGEPDSLALRDVGTLAIGLPGTVIPGHKLAYTAPWMLALRTARAVCIWTDHDDAGVRLAHRLTNELRALDVPHIRRVRWPCRPEKDVNDLHRVGALADDVAMLEETL